MTKEEKKELYKQNRLVNIKGDLLFLISDEKKFYECKNSRERWKYGERLDTRTAKLANSILEFYAIYSDEKYSEMSLSTLRLEILFFLKKNNFFEDDVIELLENYFILSTETINLKLDEVKQEPVYKFNFKKFKEN